MKWMFFLAALLSCSLSLSAAKQKKEQKPKQEKLSTLHKNARTALKNRNGQDGARNALLGALARPELKNKQRAKIYYTAALLEESLNGIENQKAYLKQPYDTARFFNKLCDMYGQLRLCDSVDYLPDAKGNVNPSFHKKTHALRKKHRGNIISGGKFFMAKRNYAAAYPFFDLYCTYKDKKSKRDEVADSLVRNATLWATLSAFLSDNAAGTVRHADAAISFSDSATAAVLQEYKVRSYGKLNNDSAWVAALKQGIETYPQHDYFFVQLADWYFSHQQFSEERALADKLIARTGGKYIHYYAKSKSYLSEDNYEACIMCADSTIALAPDFADAYYNKGISYLNMAIISQEMSCKDVKNPQYTIDKQKTQNLYRLARPCMEKLRQLQPDRQERWAPSLYRIYLNLNLGTEFVEIERLLNAKPK